MPGRKSSNLKEQLIKAGINEINYHSIADFSIRRVASLCGVSSAAPYKHFKNKQDFVAGIIKYVNDDWTRRQQVILSDTSLTTRQILVEFSVEYVKFLVENPFLRSLIMYKDEELDSRYDTMRGELSAISHRMVDKYCDEVGMDEETHRRKLYVVRALIYGAALLFDNNELEFNEENLSFVRTSIDREFDLD
ncbi:MAG: TetR/AcrR family transcriptional regulator [Clostridiales bacterium]|nr:TetR/AcrR family transcriptional regulator [Clostridiales bacterium]